MRLFATAIALVALVAMATPAQAGLVLTIDDLGTGGIEVIVVDGKPAFFMTTTKGDSTHADAFGGTVTPDGVVMFSGSVGAFSVQITAGTSKPMIGSPTLARLDMFNMTVTSMGHPTSTPHSLRIMLTDTDYVLNLSKTGSMGSLYLDAGGTTDGAVSGFAEIDLGNKEFSIGSGGPIVTLFTPILGPGAFSFAGHTSTGLSNPFSLSITVLITHSDPKDATSFNFVASAPEPTSLALIGVGVLGFVARRRRKKS